MEYVNTDYELIDTNYELGIDFCWNLIINVIRLCLNILVLVRIWTIDNCILSFVKENDYYFNMLFFANLVLFTSYRFTLCIIYNLEICEIHTST